MCKDRIMMYLHGALCSFLFNLLCNMDSLIKKKVYFDHLTPPQGSRVCVRTVYW